MRIGVFYSGVGMSAPEILSDPVCYRIRCALVVSGSWTDQDFTKAGAILAQYTKVIRNRDLDLPELNRFLSQNKPLMLSLLKNPYLIEHDTFTELMQALFHTTRKLWRIFRIRIMRICPGI